MFFQCSQHKEFYCYTIHQQMNQKPHHSEHPVFMNSPAQTAMYIQKLSRNKVTNTIMSECYCDFDQYMAHVKQMIHIRLKVVTTTISAFAPQWYQGLYSRVKTLLSSVCCQEVITCFTSAPIAITCQPGGSQGFSES